MMVDRRNSTARRKYRQWGITLIETMVVMTILVILTAISLPAFKEMIINRRLEGKAREYVTHMSWARSLAVSSNQAVNLRISETESASCYVVFHGPVNDCSCDANGTACATPGNSTLLVILLAHSEGVRLRARTASAITRIDPTQGTLSPTLTAIFTADNGKAIHNISNILGRTRSCTPGGASFGFSSC